jgi:putative membrane protein
MLVFSMFLPRIGLLFGWVVPHRFIGFQIGGATAAVLLHGVLTLGLGGTLMLLGLSVGMGLAVEWVGVRKGWVFGRYRYTHRTGPRLFRSVPVFIPLGWGILIYMGFWTAKALLSTVSKPNPPSAALFIPTAAALVTLWDMAADPLLVREGAWIWDRRGSYHGIPFSNFIGWFATAYALYAAFLLLAGVTVLETTAGRCIESLPVLGFSVFSGVFTAACFERRMVVPGLAGSACAALGLVLVMIFIF